MCEHGYPHHRHAEDAAVLTGLILDGHRQTDRQRDRGLINVCQDQHEDVAVRERDGALKQLRVVQTDCFCRLLME